MSHTGDTLRNEWESKHSVRASGSHGCRLRLLSLIQRRRESDDVRRDAIRKVLFADRGRFDGRSVCRKQRKYRFRIASFYASVMQFSLSTCKTQSLHEKKRLAQNSFDFQVRTVNYGCTAATEMLSSAARTLRAKKIC
jgi:hypothetical protein